MVGLRQVFHYITERKRRYFILVLKSLRKCLTIRGKYSVLSPRMGGRIINLFQLFILAFCMLVLASCRTTVPTPTMSVSDKGSPLPSYSMHNIGPQRVMQSRAARFADLNQDGHLDLMVGGRASVDGFHVEWGDGEGHWQLQDGPATGMQPRAFAVADVDGNGSPEVLIGGEGDQKGLQVWTLDTVQQKWHLHSVPAESDIYRDVALADVNEDGWPDIIAAQGSGEPGGGIYVWLNDAAGGWLSDVGPMVEGLFTDIAVADLNTDGHMDIVAARRGGLGADVKGGKWRQVGGVQIWYGDGTARWELEALPADGDAESVTVADINGDGYMDLSVGLYRLGIRAWTGSSSGWNRHAVVDTGTWKALRVGDLDGDGRRELLAASGDGSGLGVWRWQDSGFVAQSHLIPNFGVYSDVDLGDIRDTGRLDIAAVRADGGVEVWSDLKASPAPARRMTGIEAGEALAVFFDTGSAMLSERSQKMLQAWYESLHTDVAELQLTLEGRADVRPIHSEVFPNNAALSRARAEAVAAWLVDIGMKREQIKIIALGSEQPLPPGHDELSLQKNRRVLVKAFEARSVRLPDSAGRQTGRDMFHVDENTVFKMLDGVPGYKVGPGDELSITLWQGAKGEEYKVIVQVDGTVSLPYQEALAVSGMTPREIDRHVTKLLSRYERHPRVDVRVIKAQSKTVSIFGEVQSLLRQPTGPGNYFLTGKETLVDFLSRAGGPTKDADLTKVQIIRGGKTVLLNLDHAIKQGDWSENAVVDDGDTVFIPSLAQSKRRIYVLGEVKKPGIVEFTGDINFLDAVSKSGGFGEGAYFQDIRIVRSDRDSPQILPIAFDRFMEQGDLTQNLALRDKDVLIIPRSPIGNWNQFIKDITPTLDILIFRPLEVWQQALTIRELSRRIP